MLKLFQWGQPVLKGLCLKAMHRLMFLNVPGLVHQHLADPSLPAGNTLEGLTDSATKPSQASLRRAEERPVHAQDLEVF